MLYGAAGLLLILLTLYQSTVGGWNYIVTVLTLPFAAFLVYCALQFQFPSLFARRLYRYTKLPGRSFTAEFSPTFVKIAGKHLEWGREWEGFELIMESPRLFLFYDGYAMFIFAKRYFASDQIHFLQQLISKCWKASEVGS